MTDDPHGYVTLSKVLFVLMCLGIGVVIAVLLTALILDAIWAPVQDVQLPTLGGVE